MFNSKASRGLVRTPNGWGLLPEPVIQWHTTYLLSITHTRRGWGAGGERVSQILTWNGGKNKGLWGEAFPGTWVGRNPGINALFLRSFSRCLWVSLLTIFPKAFFFFLIIVLKLSCPHTSLYIF